MRVEYIHPYMRNNFTGTPEIRKTFKEIHDQSDQKLTTINNEEDK